MDMHWWRQYGTEAVRTFHGERITTHAEAARTWRIQHIRPVGDEFIASQSGRIAIGSGPGCNPNSGYCAIQIAIQRGARRVVLLGYDCGRTDGRSHWHGDHPAGLGNGIEVKNGVAVEKYAGWRRALERLAPLAAARGIEIINASRATTVECFTRMPLEDALHAEEQAAAA